MIKSNQICAQRLEYFYIKYFNGYIVTRSMQSIQFYWRFLFKKRLAKQHRGVIAMPECGLKNTGSIFNTQRGIHFHIRWFLSFKKQKYGANVVVWAAYYTWHKMHKMCEAAKPFYRNIWRRYLHTTVDLSYTDWGKMTDFYLNFLNNINQHKFQIETPVISTTSTGQTLVNGEVMEARAMTAC